MDSGLVEWRLTAALDGLIAPLAGNDGTGAAHRATAIIRVGQINN
jgi:hypothetical protein